MNDLLTNSVSLEDGRDSVSRGWGSVGRRLAGATLSLPALDVDDEAEPLHATINASLRPAPQTGDQSASANKTAQPHRRSHSPNQILFFFQFFYNFFL